MKEPSPALRQLLHELEHCIGSQTYNGNIQNFASWGEWEGEGREFRYPVRYTDAQGELDRYKTQMPYEWNESEEEMCYHSLSMDEMNSAHYAFGANQLYVFRGIMKALEHIESQLGINIESLLKDSRKS